MMTDKEIRQEETSYGFRFGAATVERLYSTENGTVAIRVKTDCGRAVDIKVSPTGKVISVLGMYLKNGLKSFENKIY